MSLIVLSCDMSGQGDVIDCTGMCLVSVMSSIVLGCDVGHEDF